MDGETPPDSAGPPEPSALDLWSYDGIVLANMKDAESGISRAVWWVALTMFLEVLVAFNGAQFRPGSTVPLSEAGLELKAPGFALAILLPLLASYWGLQAMHHWLSTNTLTVVHYATLELIAERAESMPNLYLLGRPLLPTISFGGRPWSPRHPPPEGELVTRQRVGNPVAATVLVGAVAALHVVVFTVIRPDVNTWWFLAWLVAVGATVGFLWLALRFSRSFEEWKRDDTLGALRPFGAARGGHSAS